MPDQPPTQAATELLTERLRLRRLVADDAPFILELLNDPGWLRYIGDKGVRTLDDARSYIENGPGAMYARHGFGLYHVSLRDGAAAIGLCGLLKRDALEHVDIGFAFLPAFRGQGLAFEAASATLEHARRDFGLRRIVAIASPDNAASAALLTRIGLRREGGIRLDPAAEELAYFVIDLPAAGAGA